MTLLDHKINQKFSGATSVFLFEKIQNRIFVRQLNEGHFCGSK